MWTKAIGAWWDDNIVHGGLNTSAIAEEVKTWKLPESGKVSFKGLDFGWGGAGEEDMLKYGFMALGVFVVYKLASK